MGRKLTFYLCHNKREILFFFLSLSRVPVFITDYYIHSRGTIVELDVCIRTGERERGQLQGGAYRPTKPLNRRGGGRKKNTHTQRACICQFNWERSSRNNNISSTTTETAGFYKISRSIQFRGGERKKNLSISQSRWRRLSRYTKVWVGLILNSPLFFW